MDRQLFDGTTTNSCNQFANSYDQDVLYATSMKQGKYVIVQLWRWLK